MTFNTEKNVSRPLGDYDRLPVEATDETEVDETEKGPSTTGRSLGNTAIVPAESRATTGYGLRHGDSTPNPPEGLTYSA